MPSRKHNMVLLKLQECVGVLAVFNDHYVGVLTVITGEATCIFKQKAMYFETKCSKMLKSVPLYSVF